MRHIYNGTLTSLPKGRAHNDPATRQTVSPFRAGTRPVVTQIDTSPVVRQPRTCPRLTGQYAIMGEAA